MVQNQVKVKRTQEPNHLLSGVVRSRNKKKKKQCTIQQQVQGKVRKTKQRVQNSERKDYCTQRVRQNKNRRERGNNC